MPREGSGVGVEGQHGPWNTVHLHTLCACMHACVRAVGLWGTIMQIQCQTGTPASASPLAHPSAMTMTSSNRNMTSGGGCSRLMTIVGSIWWAICRLGGGGAGRSRGCTGCGGETGRKPPRSRPGRATMMSGQVEGRGLGNLTQGREQQYEGIGMQRACACRGARHAQGGFRV